MKSKIKFEELKQIMSPCYLDETGNIITVIALEDTDLPTPNKSFEGVCLIARISKDLDIEHIESFNNWESAEEALHDYCKKNNYTVYSKDEQQNNELGYSFTW